MLQLTVLPRFQGAPLLPKAVEYLGVHRGYDLGDPTRREVELLSNLALRARLLEEPLVDTHVSRPSVGLPALEGWV